MLSNFVGFHASYLGVLYESLHQGSFVATAFWHVFSLKLVIFALMRFLGAAEYVAVAYNCRESVCVVAPAVGLVLFF